MHQITPKDVTLNRSETENRENFKMQIKQSITIIETFYKRKPNPSSFRRYNETSTIRSLTLKLRSMLYLINRDINIYILSSDELQATGKIHIGPHWPQVWVQQSVRVKLPPCIATAPTRSVLGMTRTSHTTQGKRTDRCLEACVLFAGIRHQWVQPRPASSSPSCLLLQPAGLAKTGDRKHGRWLGAVAADICPTRTQSDY